SYLYESDTIRPCSSSTSILYSCVPSCAGKEITITSSLLVIVFVRLPSVQGYVTVTVIGTKLLLVKLTSTSPSRRLISGDSITSSIMKPLLLAVMETGLET